MLTQILHNAKLFNGQIDHLKSLAPIFPELYFEEKGDVIWVTTMVVFNYLGVKYKRHHVESYFVQDEQDNPKALKSIKERIIHKAEMTQIFAKPYKGDEVL